MCYFNSNFFLRVYNKLINIRAHAFKKTLILTLLNNSFSIEYLHIRGKLSCKWLQRTDAQVMCAIT